MLVPGFGMNTRLTGLGSQRSWCCCAQSASSAFSWACNATIPSTPAVARPALISVTRRTPRSVLARERSINFCRLRTFFGSPACDAVKILCRRRRTSSSTRRQSIDDQSRTSPPGPFTMPAPAAGAGCPALSILVALTVSNVPFGSGVMSHESAQAHPARVSPLSGRAAARIRPVIRTDRRESRSPVPVSCCLSAAGISLSSRPVPLRD